MFREMLATCLTNDPTLTLVGSVVSGAELVQLTKIQRPAVVVFEADAPRWSNDRLISLLLAARPRVRIIGVHEALPPANVIRAYQAGVAALVLYSSGFSALLGLMRAPSPALEAARAAQTGAGGLTEREMEVLYLISAGYSADQAAWAMGITHHTLEHYKRQIFAKLDVHDQARAAATAARLGLTGSPPRGPGQEYGAAKRPPYLSVAVRGPAGDVVDRARKVLDEHDILLVEEDDQGARPAAGAGRVTVLVVPDPSQVEWARVGNLGDVVMVVTEETKRHHIAESWARGSGVVPAWRLEELLPTAVRAAGHGHLIVDAAYSRAILAPGQRPHGPSASRWLLTLTPREQEILNFIGYGHSMKQTAQALGISVRTVENLQSNLFRKLRVRSRTAALAAARELGLLDERNDREQLGGFPATT
jgi:DNA-binding NarL/FixJ family response regulator